MADGEELDRSSSPELAISASQGTTYDEGLEHERRSVANSLTTEIVVLENA
jgi:hypothetical protein